MNRSIFLLFLCVFDLSEVALSGEKMRISGDVGEKHSNVVRLVRSATSQNVVAESCRRPKDSQCNDVCIHFGSRGGGTRKDSWNGMCTCDAEKNPKTEEMCEEGCKILGFDGGFVPSDDKLDCECNPCRENNNGS